MPRNGVKGLPCIWREILAGETLVSNKYIIAVFYCAVTYDSALYYNSETDNMKAYWFDNLDVSTTVS